jgi:HTH-type transcriptional regulator / antitoxin HigA
MTAKPIRTPAEHKAALRRLKTLILSNGDDSQSDEIEVMTALIEKYERQHFTINAPTPVAAIKFRMEQTGLTPRQLEPFIGSRARVSEVLGGKRTLSLDMIRALHDGLGIPYESLIEKPDVKEPQTFTVSQPVLNKLENIGLKITADRIEEFLHKAFGSQPLPALLPRRTRTQRASAKTDDTALLLWQAAALVRAAKYPPRISFDRKILTNRFLRELAKLSALPDGPKKAKELLTGHGIIFLVNPTFPGTFLDGAAMLLHEKIPIIALTLRHDRVDNFWFTLLHELAHLARHYNALLRDQFAFFDDLDLASEDEREIEADDLARESLIPSSLLTSINWHAYSANEDMQSLAANAGVHVAIAAGRWQREHADYRKFSRLIERNTIRNSIARELFKND